MPEITINTDTNLLKAFDKIEVNNLDKISEDDRIFCENQQKSLYETLDHLKKWYDLFLPEVLKYKDTFRIKIKTNGEVEFHEPHDPNEYNTIPVNYKKFQFFPFQTINIIVKNRQDAIKKFGNSIFHYFSQTYNIHKPDCDIGYKSLSIDYKPNYVTYVDTVLLNLGGLGFTEAAENELIESFHNTIHRYHRHDLPEIKGKTIIFYDLLTLETNNRNGLCLRYESKRHLHNFCKGLAFFGQGRFNGDWSIIFKFNEYNLDFSDHYSLAIGADLKFFKNGRVDIRFKDAATAQHFYKTMKLSQLEI